MVNQKNDWLCSFPGEVIVKQCAQLFDISILNSIIELGILLKLFPNRSCDDAEFLY